MEEGVNFLTFYKEIFRLKRADAGTYSPLVLAYIGDAVYELMIRTKIVNDGNMQVNKLHRKSSSLVKAKTQADLIKVLKPYLTEEETAVFKRGRNAKSATVAKNADMTDYRMATGFEALIGWLFLSERFERMTELTVIGLKEIGELP
ncbi:MAG: Mini-ribonuclease 3 [Lachnospiraceae bacterium]